MKTILVAVDFSAASVAAVQQAVKLATVFESRLLVLHVLHDPTERPGFYSSKKAGKKVFRNMEEAARRMMTEFVEQHLKDQKKTEPRILPGIPGDEIVRQAGKEKADLVVIGTRGHSGLQRLLLGSVADRVIRGCSCPVLSVHDDGKKG